MIRNIKINATVNALLRGAWEDDRDVRPLKLQKLLYFTHGHFSAKHKRPLFDEPFSAWPYGPVLLSVYKHFEKYGRKVIDELAEGVGGKVYTLNQGNISKEVDDVVRIYAPYGDMTLSELSHRMRGGWQQASNKGWNTLIQQKDIEKEFGNKAPSPPAEYQIKPPAPYDPACSSGMPSQPMPRAQGWV